MLYRNAAAFAHAAMDVKQMELSISAIQLIAVLLAVVLATVAMVKKTAAFSESKQRLPPGPRLRVPVFGDWAAVGNRITAQALAKLSEEYGDIYMLNMGRRRIVVLNSPEVAKEMMVTQGVAFGSRATNIILDIFVGGGTQDLAFAVYGEHWRRARRIMTLPMFTTEAARRWKARWAANADDVISSLTPGVAIVLRPHFQLMMYNDLYEMTFGYSFQGLHDPRYQEVRHLNDERGRLVQSLDYNYADFNVIFLPLMLPYLYVCYSVRNRRHRVYQKFIDEYQNKRNSLENKHFYAMEHMLVGVENKELTKDSVLYILENINSAGIPTMLSSLEWTLAELILNPHIQDELYHELKSVDDIDKEAIDSKASDPKVFPYLNAVLKEVMRLHTIVPLIVPHMNLQPSKLAGYDIPPNTRALVNAWWLANNPKWWDKPEVFNPKRFLDTEDSCVDMNGNNFKFLPFGAGRRQCPGLTIALTVVTTTVAKLILKFQVLPPSSTSKLDMQEKHGQFLLELATPLKVILKERK